MGGGSGHSEPFPRAVNTRKGVRIPLGERISVPDNVILSLSPRLSKCLHLGRHEREARSWNRIEFMFFKNCRKLRRFFTFVQNDRIIQAPSEGTAHGDLFVKQFFQGNVQNLRKGFQFDIGNKPFSAFDALDRVFIKVDTDKLHGLRKHSLRHSCFRSEHADFFSA